METTATFIIGALAGSLATSAAWVIGLVVIDRHSPPETPPTPEPRAGFQTGCLKRSTYRAENPSYLHRRYEKKDSH
jgi:hypothetical protein